MGIYGLDLGVRTVKTETTVTYLQFWVLLIVFSRMHSKGSRFTLGVWGLRVCSPDVAFTFSQPFATVRNRPRDPRMAVPMVSSAKGVTFGGFTCVIASFRMAGAAL